jgi:hypothetical protein
VAAIEIGDIMRALAVVGRQVAGRNQAAAEEGLLIFAIEHNDAHEQVEVGAEELLDIRAAGPLGGGEALPALALVAQAGQGGLQLWEQAAAFLPEFERAVRVGAAQALVFAADDGQEAFGQGQVGAQVGGEVDGIRAGGRQAHGEQVTRGAAGSRRAG